MRFHFDQDARLFFLPRFWPGNLGITTYLNGTLTEPLTEPLTVDTSQPATDTIEYVATDGKRNTSTSTPPW